MNTIKAISLLIKNPTRITCTKDPMIAPLLHNIKIQLNLSIQKRLKKFSIISFLTEVIILVRSRRISRELSMAQVHSSGLMVLSILVIGEKDVQRAEVFSSMLMVISLKVNSLMTKLTVLVFTYTRMDKGMKVPGKMIYKMAWAKSSLRMVHSIRVSSTKEKSTARVSIIGKMELSMMVNGS